MTGILGIECAGQLTEFEIEAIQILGSALRPFPELHATPRWKPSTANNRRRHRRSDLAHSKNIPGWTPRNVDLAQLTLQLFFTVVCVLVAVCLCCAMSSSTSSTPKVPKSVIIVGSGAFGLSTAWALCRNPEFTYTSITVVDRQTFPTPDGSSVSQLCTSTKSLSEVRTRPESATRPKEEAMLIPPLPGRYLTHHPPRLRFATIQPPWKHRSGPMANRLCA